MENQEEPNHLTLSDKEGAALSNVQIKPEKNKAEENDEQLSPSATFFLVLSLSISTFIAAIEQTIVATAIPTIAKAFQATELEYAWIGTAYLLPAAGTSPILPPFLCPFYGLSPKQVSFSFNPSLGKD